MRLKGAFLLRIRETIPVAIGAAALLGAALASNDLLHAMRQAEAFYSIGMNALSTEGDLQEYTQRAAAFSFTRWPRRTRMFGFPISMPHETPISP